MRIESLKPYHIVLKVHFPFSWSCIAILILRYSALPSAFDPKSKINVKRTFIKKAKIDY